MAPRVVNMKQDRGCILTPSSFSPFFHTAKGKAVVLPLSLSISRAMVKGFDPLSLALFSHDPASVYASRPQAAPFTPEATPVVPGVL